MRAHQAEAAVPVLERAASVAPDHVGAQLARVRLSIQLGDFDAAREAARAALAIDPGSIPALSMLSEIEPAAMPAGAPETPTRLRPTTAAAGG